MADGGSPEHGWLAEVGKLLLTLLTGGSVYKAWLVVKDWRKQRAEEDARLAEIKRQVEADLWTRTQGDIKRLENRTSSLEARNAALEARVEDLETTLATRDGELASALRDVDRLTQLNVKQAAWIVTMERNFGRLRGFVESLVERLRAHGETVEDVPSFDEQNGDVI